MQFDLENVSSIYQKLTVVIPAADLESKIEVQLKDYAKKANLPGFRQGKAPMSVVKMKFYDALRGEAIENLINESIMQASNEKSIQALAVSKVDVLENTKDQDFKFEATIEVMPDVDVKDVKNSKIEVFDAKLEKSDIESMISDIREKSSTFVDADRDAKDGDQVVFDFEGFVDGVAFAGGKAENYKLVLGSKSFIEGFEEQLVGLKAGDEKTISVTFPENYQATELAGKPAEFKIKMHFVQEKKLAELNADFFKKAGVADQAEFEKQVEDGLQNNLDNSLQNQKRTQVLTALIELNEIEVPPTYLDNETNRLKQEQEQQYKEYFGDLPQGLNLPKELFLEQARFNVKSAILIGAYAKKDEIKAEASDSEVILQKFLKSYPNPKEMEQQIRSNQDVMRSLDAMALEAKVIDTLAEKMKVTKVKKSFQEVVYPQEQAQEAEKATDEE